MKLAAKNWKTFQHYAHRLPPWIKLHRALLDDRKFLQLPVESRALAPMLWLLAAESTDGVFDGSIEELMFRLRVAEAELVAGLEPLITAGFFIPVQPDDNSLPLREQLASSVQAERTRAAGGVAADREQVAIPEKEKEEEEGERKPGGFVGKPDFPACCTKDVIDVYHAVLPELPRCRLLPDTRKNAIAKRWRWVLSTVKEDGTPRATTAEEALNWFRDFFDRARDNDFVMGRLGRAGPHASWRGDLDYLMTDKGLSQVLEKTGAPA
ncbi:hypothetical protein GCM10023165_42770 [Variovorax defluvii]|uniref:Uncharacterized protein n=1 Tax=Variovorax defluvii TaxID=913761 RepID=A0ABP8I7X6_9BURK